MAKEKKRRVDYHKLNSSKRFCNDLIISEIAEELEIEISLVEKVAQSQSKFTVNTFRRGGMESVTYVYLGKFKVNPFKVQKMMANQMKS